MPKSSPAPAAAAIAAPGFSQIAAFNWSGIGVSVCGSVRMELSVSMGRAISGPDRIVTASLVPAISAGVAGFMIGFVFVIGYPVSFVRMRSSDPRKTSGRMALTAAATLVGIGRRLSGSGIGCAWPRAARLIYCGFEGWGGLASGVNGFGISSSFPGWAEGGLTGERFTITGCACGSVQGGMVETTPGAFATGIVNELPGTTMGIGYLPFGSIIRAEAQASMGRTITGAGTVPCPKQTGAAIKRKEIAGRIEHLTR